MRSSRLAKQGLSSPFGNLKMYPGSRCPMEFSLLRAEGSDKAPDLDYEVVSLVGF